MGEEGNKWEKARHKLHNGVWVCLSRISVADKPDRDKGSESVAPEEELWVIKLRQS